MVICFQLEYEISLITTIHLPVRTTQINQKISVSKKNHGNKYLKIKTN